MKRRGNKSTKVPNVKLRPVQAPVPRPLRKSNSILEEDSQIGSDDTSIDPCPRPFKGVVLCATGTFDKPTIFKQALELGATSTSAFTDRCALERKIPILHPSWIAESYQIWLRGDDVELADSVKRHRLSIFSGVILCPSGITDITRRTQINKLLTQHGGVYLKNLERPVRVTHLLCSGDEETDKMRYAEKFNSRGEANVHLVWEEWFWDSLEFGGRFDEETYQVRRPRPERKVTFEETAATSPPSSVATSDQPQDTQDLDPEEELATVKRLPAATLQLWGGLLAHRGYEVSDGELIKSPTKAPRPPMQPPPPSPLQNKGNGSLISQFRRANSFAPVRPEVASSSRPQPFRRTRTTTALDSALGVSSFMASVRPVRESNINGESSTSAAATGIFAGLKFIVLGEAKSPSVRTAIEENGGRMMVGLEDEDVDYIIVRLVSGSKLYVQEADESLRGKYRTECWLERCVFQERVCLPDEHITFRPLSISLPVTDAESIRLSFSGLDQAEATWITRLSRALGIRLEQFFSKKSTQLLCPSATGPKFDKALEWGTPVVTMQWLIEIATTGTVPPASEFLASGADCNAGPSRRASIMEVNIVDVKGKGKAVEKQLSSESCEAEISRAPEGDAMDVDAVDFKGKGKAVDTARKGTSPIEDSVTETMSTDSLDESNLAQFPDENGNDDLPSKGRIPSVSPRRNPLGVMPVFHADSIIATSTQLPTTPTHTKILPFGKATGPLAGDPFKQSTPTRTRSTPIIHQTPHHHNSHPKSSAPAALARRPTQREIELERKQARIPSSRSPSPLKIQRAQARQPSVPVESPTRIPREVAKALEDNITTLLGKRTSADDDPEPAHAPKASGRPGKRQRPQRPTRPQSRQASEAKIAEAPLPVYDDSARPFECEDPLNLLGDSDDNGIRVTYEDPKQEAETKRLMSLLGAGGKVQGRESQVGTRKSARIAGF
ncbi:hypothetical protein H0H92_011276 [Tricholoma furcatifolium]|nr:hypothetical protein H0H92_011276 [Tricholoma furcatifolium]